MKIGILTGTRPDIIKLAPIYWEAKKRGHEAIIIHSGQHQLFHLYEGVYKDLELPFPPAFQPFGMKRFLMRHVSKVASATGNLERIEKMVAGGVDPIREQAAVAGKIKKFMVSLLRKEKFDIVLTHGDTLTAMIGSLACYLNNIPVGHVEAGLRTFSREPYPEQGCTRTADAVSSLYFAATETNTQNLLNEGFPKERIFTVGNSVIDAAIWAAQKGGSEKIKNLIGSDGKPVIYFSSHRKENLISRERFTAIAGAAIELSKKYRVIWSVRPGTRVALKNYGIEIAENENLKLVSDIPNYTDIMYLMSKCRFVCTDSGSMQEEICGLHVPCMTLRFVTDRPESVEVGANILAPPRSVEEILRAADFIEKNYEKMRQAKNPYGDGTSSKKILDAIEKFEGRLIEWKK